MIRYPSTDEIPKIIRCYKSAFKDSITTRFGDKFISKIIEWYIVENDCFLFYFEDKGRCVGFCGGKIGSGSSSAMLQYAFRRAFVSLLARPWILFDPSILTRLRFIFSNIRKKLFNTTNTPSDKGIFHDSAGLVTIGVDPSSQGRGIGGKLMNEFDSKVASLGIYKAHLSVEKNNSAALNLYIKNGWKKMGPNGRDGIALIKRYEGKVL